ncbi:helix-turn-helix domain-containing protein [Sporichthya brevicatena]|uniref:Helix-turn-helix domain-containing protein n=1 Tax=Sporichthya brevicatena TaxID=171442 RepID=A0ABN1HCT1_9ACTN
MALPSRDARIAGVAALDQPLRRDLYALMAELDTWVGRDEAAERLSVPRSVAAFHLDKLTEVGLLEVRYERPPGKAGPGAGRPAKLYRRARSELTVSVPERQYELAGEILADAVRAAADTGCPVREALSRVAREKGSEVGAAARADLPRRPSGRALRDAAMSALRELGFEPREHRGEIALANCPFHRLMERHTLLICGMNLDLLTGLADGLEASDRLAPRLDPEPPMCCVRIGPA